MVNLSDPSESSLYRCCKQTLFKEKEDGLHAKKYPLVWKGLINKPRVIAPICLAGMSFILWKVSRVLSQTWRKVINDCFALLPACCCMGLSKSSRFDSLKLSLELGLFILDHPLIYHSRLFSVHVASLFS